jgi:hypothetical protein
MTAACLVLCGIIGAPSFDAPEERRAFLERIDRVLASLEAARRELPRDAFDLQGVVEVAGRDPVKLFEWVRDRTVWVPYSGTLRGATGVLLDRMGNSLDRSLLLADLLGWPDRRRGSPTHRSRRIRPAPSSRSCGRLP